ncbi:MAG: primosomal protein N' [Bacteroidales bacterium]|nr:primosomal protein N' [Bacteroidales bacterium]
MDNKNTLFADIILPLPIPKLYTYSIPSELEQKIKTGHRVIVQFGKKKLYSAIVCNIHNNKPEKYKTKKIISILDEKPIINNLQLKFWKWISEYYMCSLGEVYKAALPSGLKLESETKIIYNESFSEHKNLNDTEYLIINILEKRNILTINEISSLIESSKSLSVIKNLINKNAVYVVEKIKDSYKPKLVKYVKLPDDFKNKKNLNTLLDKLQKAPKQFELLVTYLTLSEFLNNKTPKEVTKKELLERVKATDQTLNSLVKKNALIIYEKEVGRLKENIISLKKSSKLNDFQAKAYNKIKQDFINKDVTLLHGVTSSGKTEIYIKLINDIIATGKQVLYLLPEIALTTQIINRLKNIFGKKVGIYHSKFNDSERVEIWNKVLNNDENSYKVILGVRSSIFLPFNNLGLIIIDEEHENTYKQFDPVPRYHARDCAIVLGKLHNAKILLGTATPSIESYYNSKNKKFGYVELTQRYKEIQLPEVIIADTKTAYRKKQMKSFFSPVLLENIETALKNKEQVILFQNRRGYSPYLECSVCGWIPECEHCNVSLTYHKYFNNLNCHYCGYTLNNPANCLACGSTSMETKGFGTEKIEDEIAIFFPEAKIARMDLDTTRSRYAYQRIISDFENNNVDILIGTQMISKGLDFDNVRIVGILNADNMLNYPDFRASERSFQLMLQVSGRAGRSEKRGKVIIQTSNPAHPIIHFVMNNDYISFYENQIKERKKFNYPPFNRLIKITIKHKNPETLNIASKQLANKLKPIFGKRLLGPQAPVINRIQNWYLKTILIKIEKDKSFSKAKTYLYKTSNELKHTKDYGNLQIVFDVDPM